MDLVPILEKCHDSLQGCILDLEETKAMRATPRWYQNELVVIGLTVVAFSAGVAVGNSNK